MFKPYLDQFVIKFVDDNLIYWRSQEEHKMHLQIALQTLCEHQLYTKQSKCEFWLFEVVLLGHVVSSVGILVDSANIKAIHKWERLR